MTIPSDFLMNSEEKVVLITGASKGIGKITREYLLSKGYIVYGTSRKGKEPNNSIQPEQDLVRLDVNDETTIQALTDYLISKHGKIDVLINNAGFALCGALIDTTTQELLEQFQTNFFGVHRLIRAIAPNMIQRRKGTIINIGSFGGRLALPYQVGYSASKAALAMYTDGLRMELKPFNLKITLIEPGDIKTDFHSGRRFVQGYDQDPIAKHAITVMHESEQKGTNPLKVAKLIHSLIKKKKLKPRYTVGKDAKLFGVLQRFLSFNIQEKLIMRTYL